MEELLEYLNRFQPETLRRIAEFLTDGGAPLAYWERRILRRVLAAVTTSDPFERYEDAAAVLYVASDRKAAA